MKKKKIILMLVLVLILAFGLTGPAFAADTQVIVNFDDLTAYDPVPIDYAGLTWESGWTVSPEQIDYYSGRFVYLPHSFPYAAQYFSTSPSVKISIDFSSLGTDVIFDGAWFGGVANTGTIHFEGWRDDTLVTTSGNLGFDQTNFDSSRYLAADFGQPVDKVVVCVESGAPIYSTFGMDDFTYTIPDSTIAVDLDVTSDINIGSKGVLPLSILGSEDFDVTQIDPATILIGSTSISEKGNKLQFAFEDVNEDGILDAVFKISIPDLVLNGDLDQFTSSLTVTGALLDGTQFEGTDEVILVP